MDIVITEEQQDDLKSILKDLIKDSGIRRASKIVNGLENLFKVFDIKTPMDFLNLFNDLEIVESQENPHYTLFRYRPGHNIIVLSTEYVKSGTSGSNGYVGIIWDDVWEILWNDFNMKQSDIVKLTLQWIKDAYHLDNIELTIDVRNPDMIESL